MRMMSARRGRLISVLVVVVMAGLAVFAAQQAWRDGSAPASGSGAVSSGPALNSGQRVEEAPPVIRFVKDPKPVPDVTVRDLDGRPITSADWRGKVTIVNFWATWCVPCLQEIPDFVALGGWLMQAPVAAQSSKPDPAKVRAAIDRYVQQKDKLKGGFFVRDAQENQVRDLTFDSVHQDIESRAGNLQVVCVDFQDRVKNRLDLDFSLKPTVSGDLEVTAIKIHKVNGVERK